MKMKRLFMVLMVLVLVTLSGCMYFPSSDSQKHDVEDTTPPTLKIVPVSTTPLMPGSIFSVSAEDPSKVYDISYRWNNEPMETVTFNTVKAVLPLKVPAESKKHTLQLYVRDASKRFNTEGWKTYSIDCRPKDTTPPTVTVSPASGSTIAPGSKIIIHIEDGSGVYDVSHRWDKNSPTTKQLETMGSATFEIIAPLSAGTHTVQLYVRDNSSNYNTQGWLPYSFTIKQ